MSNGTTIQKDKNYDALESRLSKLESGSKGEAFMQYLIYPLILALIGVYFERQIENMKDQTQRMQLAQSMLASMFADNHDEAIASERILAKITDRDFAAEINKIVEDYYAKKMQADVKNGNIDGAVKIKNALDAVGGSLKDRVTAGVDASTLQTVESAKLAAQKESAGYDDLLNGNLAKALEDFDASEKAYPRFHNSYEIARLLRQHRQEFDKSTVQRQVLDKIVTDFWGYIPKDILQKLRQIARGQAGTA
jgi:hypothetical protein